MMANDLEIYNSEADNWWKTGGKLEVLKHFNTPRFSYFDNIITDWKAVRVLDIGCGGGFASEFMAEKGADVCGIDLSAKSIQTAEKHASDNGLEIDYRSGNANDLPYEDKTFDIVLCVDVLEHVPDLEKVISEIHRVLKDGGTFLFDTINKTFKSKFMMIWMLEYLLREIPRGVHDWNMFIKPETLTSRLTETGFKDVEIKGFDVKGKDKATGGFNVAINGNTSVMYIGSCRKEDGTA